MLDLSSPAAFIMLPPSHDYQRPVSGCTTIVIGELDILFPPWDIDGDAGAGMRILPLQG